MIGKLRQKHPYYEENYTMTDHQSKPVNIEKLDFETVIHENIPYTLVSTPVIQKISDAFAGFIWVFLSSLPPDWKVNRNHLMKHFNVGEQKLKGHLAYLAKVNLIEYVRVRLPNGTLGPVSIRVLNGSRYKENTESTIDTTGMKNHPVVEPPSGKSSTYKNNKEPTKENKTTTTNTNNGGGSFNSFEKQCLKLRVPTDTREPEEFIENVYHHIQYNSPQEKNEATRQQMIIKLLKKLNGFGAVFHSNGYVSRADKIKMEKQKLNDELTRMYGEYVARIKCDISLGLKDVATPIKSFEEWKATESS